MDMDITDNQGIGRRYQEETRYIRERTPSKGVDWFSRPAPFKTYPECLARIALPAPFDRKRMSLWKVLAERRSVRDFVPQPLELPTLAQLLWATQGVTRREGSYLLRTAPSAGALYPVETYVVANRVSELEPGVYHLDVAGWSLEFLREGLIGPELAAAGLHQEMLASAAAVFVWTTVIGRCAWKYGQRAYRYIYLDAGHIAQNLYLAAQALGLGCCTVGAFFDAEVNRIIGVDGTEEFTIYMGAVGYTG